MAKLHEVLSCESELEGAHKTALENTKAEFIKQVGLFLGFHKRTEMFDEDAPEAPHEHSEMTKTVYESLAVQREHAVRYLDAVLQKERTNQEARADILIDGTAIAKDVPATFLLGLETKLRAILSVYEAAPTLAPGYKWEPDKNRGEHVWAVVDDEVVFKTEKIFKAQVLYEATKEHPAQVKEIPETKNVGRKIKEVWVGLISTAEKNILVGRIRKLLRAVKQARQRANSTEVVDTSIGEELFTYIHG